MKKKIFIFVPFPASNAAVSYKICCFVSLRYFYGKFIGQHRVSSIVISPYSEFYDAA